MMRLNELFNGLAPVAEPSSRSLELSACLIPSMPGHRVARDSSGHALLLLKATVEKGPQPPPIRLENLSIAYGIHCRIWHGDQLIEEEIFTALSCLSHDPGIRSQFFNVGELFLNCLGSNPTPQQVSHSLNMLVELFRALSQPPRKAVQGLWGELFLLSQSANVEVMMEGWHSEPGERYDFSSGGCRIEVKCCFGHQRKHHFSLLQLLPPEGTQAIIASICTERSGGGVSVNELLGKIRSRLSGNFTLLFRLETVVASTLGSAMLQALEDSFDFQMAVESLMFFDAADVPRPTGEIPREVSDIRFVADLTRAKPMDLDLRGDTNELLCAVR